MPTVRSNGIELYFEEAGDGPPLVLLHGLGSRCEDWQLQLPAFARHYRTIAVDLRGHGRSEKPPGPYSMAQLAADVVGLLDALAIDSAHFVGLSMGGMVAFQLGVDGPERVRSLTIVNSAPSLVPRTPREWLYLQQRLLLARLFKPGRTGRFLSRRLFPKPEQAQLRAMMVTNWSQNDHAAYTAAMRAIVDWSVAERVASIRCPVLVIAGERDYLPLSAKQEYTARIKGARLELFADSGHATPIDQAERFNACVLAFLAEIQHGQAETGLESRGGKR